MTPHSFVAMYVCIGGTYYTLLQDVDFPALQIVAGSPVKHHYFFFSWHDIPLVGLGLFLIHEDFCGLEITHDIPQSAGLFWTSDKLAAETCT